VELSEIDFMQTNLAQVLLYLSIASNITAYVIYFVSIFRNKIKPHAFTFLAWSLIIGVNFLVQIFSGVGKSSILLGTNLLGCFFIFIFCLIKGYTSYDKIDWLCLILAIVAIILWVITRTPLYSVILSCIIDLLAFIPSFRKSFHKPQDDSALTFIVSGFEYLLSFPSYQVFSFLVLLYPVCVLTLDFSYAGMILIRRWQLTGR
jgi:hypothetical protein